MDPEREIGMHGKKERKRLQNGKITVETCEIEGLKVITPAVFGDERAGSPTYGQWHGVLLSAENKKQFFIPKNFAHGFVVLSESAEFAYKCTDFYHPNDEGGLAWNDPEIGVDWPMPEGMTEKDLIISEKDQHWGGIREYRK